MTTWFECSESFFRLSMTGYEYVVIVRLVSCKLPCKSNGQGVGEIHRVRNGFFRAGFAIENGAKETIISNGYLNEVTDQHCHGRYCPNPATDGP